MALFFQKKKPSSAPFCSMVVAAAGFSTRMEGLDKALLPLGGIPILARTLLVLEACPAISELIVVTRSDLIPMVANLCRDFSISKAAKVVAGGMDRTHSVLNGVRECSPQAELIGIHDGARPLVTAEVLEKVIAAAALSGAAAPGVPVQDTIKRAEAGRILETPDRAELFAVQTPQVFEASLILAALTQAEQEGVVLTDDCGAVERLGMTVTLTEGTYENLKITTPVDLVMGEAILAWREQR